MRVTCASNHLQKLSHRASYSREFVAMALENAFGVGHVVGTLGSDASFAD